MFSKITLNELKNYFIIVFIILIGCIIILTGCTKKQVAKNKINIIFRFDDYSALSSTNLELKILDAFREREASITFGVIPFVCSENTRDPSPQKIISLTSMKANILKKAIEDSILDVALHGYSHKTNNADYMSEFSGLDYNIQEEKLYKGKKYLEDIVDAEVTTFIPPWNHYDLTTLRVLKNLGFTTLSANRNGKIKEESNLSLLPCTCNITQLRNAVKSARNSPDANPVIVVLFHEYDFKEINDFDSIITFKEFSDLLRWVKLQKDTRILSINQATKLISDLSAKRYMCNQHISSFLNLNIVPTFFCDKFGNQYFETNSKLIKLFWFQLVILYLTIFVFATLTSFILYYLFFSKYLFTKKLSLYGSLLTLAFISYYTLHDLHVYFKGLAISIGMFGIFVGTCLCCFYLKRKQKTLNKYQ